MYFNLTQLIVFNEERKLRATKYHPGMPWSQHKVWGRLVSFKHSKALLLFFKENVTVKKFNVENKNKKTENKTILCWYSIWDIYFSEEAAWF